MEMLDRNGIKNKYIELRIDKFIDFVEFFDEVFGLFGYVSF